jgi:hypothetical protein
VSVDCSERKLWISFSFFFFDILSLFFDCLHFSSTFTGVPTLGAGFSILDRFKQKQILDRRMTCSRCPAVYSGLIRIVGGTGRDD